MRGKIALSSPFCAHRRRDVTEMYSECHFDRFHPPYLTRVLHELALARAQHRVVVHAARQRQLQTVLAGLDALERVTFAKDPTIGEISVACAFGYVEFRMPDLDWKSSRPKLSAWYDKFCEYPSMKATAPAAP